MSYDIYCYRSKVGYPDRKEALRLISKDADALITDDRALELDSIATALCEYNPDLVRFQFDHQVIAKIEEISVQTAQQKYRHIELSTPDGALATQITLMGSSASIAIPYWYTDSSAAMVFDKANQYLRIICNQAGYLAFDPQTETAFDPRIEDLRGLAIYTAMTQQLNSAHRPSSVNSKNDSLYAKPKPWWKFW